MMTVSVLEREEVPPGCLAGVSVFPLSETLNKGKADLVRNQVSFSCF